MLYIIPTPIGNLEDITLRALRILKESSLVLAEDTRTTRVLLDHYDIHTHMESYHKYNEHGKLAYVADRLQAGETVALVSDAGTPGISDPGFLVVRECVRQGIEVECLPGPTAAIPALVVSGIPCDRFVFVLICTIFLLLVMLTYIKINSFVTIICTMINNHKYNLKI
mgnify:CR=1 FL=1